MQLDILVAFMELDNHSTLNYGSPYNELWISIYQSWLHKTNMEIQESAMELYKSIIELHNVVKVWS